MRPHGKASINASYPRALAICDRCGARYNHAQLSWQYEWRGTKLQNINRLVCQTCLDIPQEQLRMVVYPPDPVPIMNARPEQNVSNDNPMSPIGMSANQFMPQYGSRIGNLTGGGGINAPFDGNPNKQSWMCANNSISNSSYNNYVGINWSGNVANLNMPSSMLPPVIEHSLLSFTTYAPLDRSFLGNTPTSYVVQSSPVNTPIWGAWTTISSGTTAGTAGEIISGECTGARHQFHRIAFLGDQINYVAVALVEFNVAQIGEPITAGSS